MFWSRQSTPPTALLYRKILWGWSILSFAITMSFPEEHFSNKCRRYCCVTSGVAATQNLSLNFTGLFLIYCLQPWRPKYATMDHLCWLIALASSLQDIVHLIYRWVVSPSQTCLPYQDLNCQQGEDFALFHQIGFVIIMMILLCCGCLHCVPNTLVVLASPHNH